MTRAHPNQSSIGHLPVLVLKEVQTAPEATLALWVRMGGWEAGCSDGSGREAGGWDAHEGGAAGPALPKAHVLADPQEPSLGIWAICTGQGAPKGCCGPSGRDRPSSL